MSYIAMARKWRPESFADLVGQEHVAATLENAIRGERLHHAFLFTGTRGVGKTTSARILAKTLNCKEGDPVIPCGQCSSCKEIAAGTSLDVIEIDGASNNSVDDVRDLIEQVKYVPMNGRYKIFVIDEVHMLSRAAFNALLKTLEEPPGHVIFIFATTEVNKVPTTILSRIQRFDFKRIGPAKVVERLSYICDKEAIEFEEEALHLIAEQADGSMRDALTLFDQIFSFAGQNFTAESTRQVLGVPPQDMFFSLISHIADHNQKACFEIVEEFFQKGIEVSDFLDGMGKFLRDMLMARIAPDSGLLECSLETRERLTKAAQNFEHGDLLRLSKMLSDLQQTIRNAPHPRIAVEMGLSRMAYLDRIKDVRRLLLNLPVEGITEKK
jgi:DNA polymerase-3 subunit gamma/tau